MPTDAILTKASADQTIGESLDRSGVSRRDFLTLCSILMAAAPVGLALTEKGKTVEQVANAVARAKKPSVIWLHFQDCTGCSETLLHTSRPDVADLILNTICRQLVLVLSPHPPRRNLTSLLNDEPQSSLTPKASHHRFCDHPQIPVTIR